MCITPLRWRHRFSSCAILIILFELTFSISFYLKFFHTGQLYFFLQRFDMIYFTRQTTWFLLGRLFTFGVILSVCSRSAQQQLIERMAILDSRVRSHLRVDLSFCRLNIEFVVYSAAFIIYNTSDCFYEIVRFPESPSSIIYYFCCLIASNFFYIYALYAVFWARVFLNRSRHIVMALKVAVSQRYISKEALTIIMELIKLLFDVRESIQYSFGGILCTIIVSNSFLIAVSMFLICNDYERAGVSFDFCFNYPLWALALWLQIIYVVVFFGDIGEIVSKNWQCYQLSINMPVYR